MTCTHCATDDPVRCPKSGFKDDRHAWEIFALDKHPCGLFFCPRCALIRVSDAKGRVFYGRFPEGDPR